MRVSPKNLCHRPIKKEPYDQLAKEIRSWCVRHDKKRLTIRGNDQIVGLKGAVPIMALTAGAACTDPGSTSMPASIRAAEGNPHPSGIKKTTFPLTVGAPTNAF